MLTVYEGGTVGMKWCDIISGTWLDGHRL